MFFFSSFTFSDVLHFAYKGKYGWVVGVGCNRKHSRWDRTTDKTRQEMWDGHRTYQDGGLGRSSWNVGWVNMYNANFGFCECCVYVCVI